MAARHLKMFGYSPIVLFPKKEAAEKDVAKKLLLQVGKFSVPVVYCLEDFQSVHSFSDFAFIIDAIFGYSFSGKQGIREPFNTVISCLKKSATPIVSIDIPSGWDVDNVNVDENLEIGLNCQVLVSLPAPKLCASHFKGRHFVGGRFMPQELLDQFSIDLPPYKGIDMIQELVNQ